MDKFLTSMSRRTFLKGTAAGIGILAAPAIISSRALASSGELNFMGWAGYPDLAAKVFPAFEKATGIKVNFNEQPDQDAMFAQAKLSLQTGAIDVVEPTVDRIGGWAANGLVQGWDLNKLSMDNYLPGLADGKMGEMATVDGKRMIVLSVWGTEAIVYSKTEAPTEYGKASLGDLFDPKFEGKVCLRAHSALAAMGRYLDSNGKLPKPWLDSYKDEATMKELWDIALAEAVKGQDEHRPVLVGRERGAGCLSDQRRRHRPQLGFDRLQSARRRLRLHRAEGRRVRLEPGLCADGQCQERRPGARVRQMGRHARRVGGVGGRLLGQSGRQGRDRTRQHGGAGVLQLRASRRCDAEAVVVAGAAGLVHQAARRIRRQVQGRLSRQSSRTAGFLRESGGFLLRCGRCDASVLA